MAEGELLAGRYALGAELGAGSAGRVRRALDRVTGDQVAVKLLHPALWSDPAAVARLAREARLAALIDSPAVVRVLDAGVDGGPFIVMELVSGPTLARVIAAHGPQPAPVVTAIAAGVATALEAAACQGIVHRDLKPSNIAISDGRIRVFDFGIARALGDATLTATGTYLGTPLYSAPERADGGGDGRADIYSLGVILYEALAGAPPFHAATPWAALHAHRTEPPPPLPADIPPPLAVLVLRCLEKDPDRRYPDALALRAAIDAMRETTGEATPGKLASIARAATQEDARAGIAPTEATVRGWPE